MSKQKPTMPTLLLTKDKDGSDTLWCNVHPSKNLEGWHIPFSEHTSYCRLQLGHNVVPTTYFHQSTPQAAILLSERQAKNLMDDIREDARDAYCLATCGKKPQDCKWFYDAEKDTYCDDMTRYLDEYDQRIKIRMAQEKDV